MTTDCGMKRGERAKPPGTTTRRLSDRFPEDFRTWLRGPALLRMAHAVAQEQTVSDLRAVFSFSAKRFHHPWRMLAMLSYAYASGLWDSRAISEVAALDPNVAALCHGEAPAAETLRRFRDQNRLAVLRCLEQLIRRLWCHHFEQELNGLH